MIDEPILRKRRRCESVGVTRRALPGKHESRREAAPRTMTAMSAVANAARVSRECSSISSGAAATQYQGSTINTQSP